MIPNQRRILRGIVLAGAAVGLLLACGRESERTAGGSQPAAPAPAAPAPAAPAPAEPVPAAAPFVPESLYEWDPAAGAQRDMEADSAACQAQITAPGLSAVAQHIQCMQAKGWKTRQPSS